MSIWQESHWWRRSMQIKYRIYMAHAFHAFRQQCMDCQLRHDRRSKWFNYSLRHLPVTILITGKPRCNYISPTGQFGQYRHKSCIRHSKPHFHNSIGIHRLQLTPKTIWLPPVRIFCITDTPGTLAGRKTRWQWDSLSICYFSCQYSAT